MKDRSKSSQIIYCRKRLLEFFKTDSQKVDVWLHEPNPAFGGLIPFDLIKFGRGHKVIAFIDNSLAENKPDDIT